MTEALRRAEAILRAATGDRVRTGFSLAPLTSFRIGGPAALYVEPESERDLMAAAEAGRGFVSLTRSPSYQYGRIFFIIARRRSSSSHVGGPLNPAISQPVTISFVFGFVI